MCTLLKVEVLAKVVRSGVPAHCLPPTAPVLPTAPTEVFYQLLAPVVPAEAEPFLLRPAACWSILRWLIIVLIAKAAELVFRVRPRAVAWQAPTPRRHCAARSSPTIQMAAM